MPCCHTLPNLLIYLKANQKHMLQRDWNHQHPRVVAMIFQQSNFLPCGVQGLYSLSGKTSYRKISWSLEAARFGFKLFQSLWNLAGTSAALLPRWLSNFRAIRPFQHPISRLRDFTRFGSKTSCRLVNRGPGLGNRFWSTDGGGVWSLHVILLLVLSQSCCTRLLCWCSGTSFDNRI